jgi:hypothetical protein
MSLPSLAPGELALPAFSYSPELHAFRGALSCAGIGIPESRLAGSPLPTDPEVTWLEDSTGRRLSYHLKWPGSKRDFRPRFTPELEVLNATSTVILRAGDLVTVRAIQGNTVFLDEEDR